MTEAVKHPFEQGLELYENNGPLGDVITKFEEGLTLSPKDSTGYTCLAWLHLLRNEGEDAVKGLSYAHKAVALSRQNAQAYFNLTLAMLVNKEKGVRGIFQRAMSLCSSNPEDYQEALENFEDALKRREDFTEAAKILNWMKDA